MRRIKHHLAPVPTAPVTRDFGGASRMRTAASEATSVRSKRGLLLVTVTSVLLWLLAMGEGFQEAFAGASR
jgi:hypothetical protein